MSWLNRKKQPSARQAALLEQLIRFNAADQKTLVHVRLDKDTAMLLKQFKLATGVEIQQVVAFALDEFLKQHPEFKTMIKQFLQELNK
jgi:hypothetical protein